MRSPSDRHTGGRMTSAGEVLRTPVLDIDDWVRELMRDPEEDPADRWDRLMEGWQREAPVCYASVTTAGAVPIIVQEQLLDDIYGLGGDLAECAPASRLMARTCIGGVHHVQRVRTGLASVLCEGCLACSVLLTGWEADELTVWLEGRLGWAVETQEALTQRGESLVQRVGPLTVRWSGSALLDPVVGAAASDDPVVWRAAWRRLARRSPLVALALLQRAADARDRGETVPSPVEPWRALWRRDIAMLMVSPDRSVRIGAAALLPRLGLEA